MKLAITYSAYREIGNLHDNASIEKINWAIMSLADNPLPDNAGQICNGCLVLEIGPHAVLYVFDEQQDLLTVLGVVKSGIQTLH